MSEENNCVFCKILNGEIKSKLLYEDELVAAFRDIKPIAPVHVLIIPKKHTETIAEFGAKDEKTAGRMIMAAKKIAEDLEISKKGYKILIRVGQHGGQEIGHVHMHLLGGAPLSEHIHPLF
jgi:histidine triad (HIT) family protein